MICDAGAGWWYFACLLSPFLLLGAVCLIGLVVLVGFRR